VEGNCPWHFIILDFQKDADRNEIDTARFLRILVNWVFAVDKIGIPRDIELVTSLLNQTNKKFIDVLKYVFLRTSSGIRY
jgi:hypothetical protein